MKVKHCKTQHKVLVTFIRSTLHFFGPWDQLLSFIYSIDRRTASSVESRTDRASPLQLQAPIYTLELELVLRRTRALSEECRKSLPPLIAALLHAKRSQAFTDILKEIQWWASVVSHARIYRHVETISAPELKNFPWDAKVGQQEQVWLKEAEQKDWHDLMRELDRWNDKHECSAEECGNVHGRRDPRFCLATQLIKKWYEQGRICDSNHLSLLWGFDEEAVNHGRLLGSGSFAAVTRSTWLGINYAQKIFNSVGLTTLRDEAEALRKLNHPHIVKVYACSEKSLLLDLMSSDLQKFIRARMQRKGSGDQPFSLPAAIDLMLQIADAVSYLHSQGMVHRDLKSSNILVDPVTEPAIVNLEDGYVFAKVTDFGLAKVKHEVTRYSHCTHNVGTRRWMAPEIFGADNDGDHLELAYPMKADVYSFGIICYEILSGEEPYSDVPLSLLYSQLTGPFPLRPQLPYKCPIGLSSLICSCWEADPRERPTFVDVCRVLRYLKGLQILQDYSELRIPIDETWPFGRLRTLVKQHGPWIAWDWAGLKHWGLNIVGPKVDIRGVRFHFLDSSLTELCGFTLSYKSEENEFQNMVGKYGDRSTDWMMFDYPSEYLVQVEGSYSGSLSTSVSFITTRKKYGPYGKAKASDLKFSTSTRERVVGFAALQRIDTIMWICPMRFGIHALRVFVVQDIVRCIESFLSDEDSNVLDCTELYD